ncbi:hypothetical protein CI109_104659 [Kwoniella shandongensis]|uniref:Uncharacterized protein n=1 Tax=Kwoniella shandongensis TaxID=1734106 RepID=A0A5M6BZI3_9TREE|nr:uncharacterized protein CI109_004825 [Kwoniella shandongensis]KAA5526825.1 hypothetical protein CI109_004825 [Kwoniella shandongensis]
MTELESVTKSLHDLLTDSSQDEGSFSRALETYLTSDESSTKSSACDAFLEVLNEEDEETQNQRRTFLLEDTALTYIPLLLPLTTKCPKSAPALLSLIASYGRPREVVLGLTEGIQYILERSEGFVVSDMEDEEGEGEDDVDWVGLLAELEIILVGCKTAIPRLPNARSTPTLLSVAETISSALPILSHHATLVSSWSVLLAICDLVEVIWEWVQTTSDAGGEQRSILSNLLFEAVTLFGHKVGAKLTERWFLSTFPRFGGPRALGVLEQASAEDWKAGAEVLERARKTAHSLDFTDQDLLDKIINVNSLTPHGSLASLNLLAGGIATDDFSALLPSPLPANILGDCLPILSAALGGSAVDAGTTWTWCLVHRALLQKNEGVERDFASIAEYDDTSMLVELLVPLTAQHPSPIMRLALFKLIGGVITLHPSSSDKIQLFKQLLEPANPFDNIRIQSLSLLREEITADPTLLSTELLSQLTPILFSSNFIQDDSPPSPVDLLNSPLPTIWTECCSLIWFISNRDTSNKTGLKTEYQDQVQEWLAGIETKLGECKVFSSSPSDGQEEQEHGHSHDDLIGEGFVLARWEDALGRAKTAMGL